MPTTKPTTKPTTTKEGSDNMSAETKPTTTKPANADAKKISLALDKLASAEYVRKGIPMHEIEALAAITPHLAKLDSSIEAVGGARATHIVRVTRYSAINGWQTLVAFPVSVGTTKVSPAGNTSADVDPTWYVEATKADRDAAAKGNSNRIYTVMRDGKPLQLKGNASTGKPVRVKMSLRKYFKEYVGVDMRDALFTALPAASVDHDKDVTIKGRHWRIELVATKSVDVRA